MLYVFVSTLLPTFYLSLNGWPKCMLWSCYGKRKISYLPEGGRSMVCLFCSILHFLTNCQSSLSVRKEFSNKRIRQTSGTIDTFIKPQHLYHSELGEGETKHHLCCDECESFYNLSKKSERDIHNVLLVERDCIIHI